MELHKTTILLEKYFEGATTLAEENELKRYFSSSEVAQEFQKYQPLFAYFSEEKEQQFTQEIQQAKPKTNQAIWWSVAASAVVFLGIGLYTFNMQNTTTSNPYLGTYDDPEVAFRETQKALALLSNHVNVGISSVQYVENYSDTRDKVFLVK